MMRGAQRFPYVEIAPSLGAASALPYVPLTLKHHEQAVSVSALVDSGAALNVLPYDVGVELGADWRQQTVPARFHVPAISAGVGELEATDCDLQTFNENGVTQTTLRLHRARRCHAIECPSQPAGRAGEHRRNAVASDFMHTKSP